jgi:hypothetical protein
MPWCARKRIKQRGSLFTNSLPIADKIPRALAFFDKQTVRRIRLTRTRENRPLEAN